MQCVQWMYCMDDAKRIIDNYVIVWMYMYDSIMEIIVYCIIVYWIYCSFYIGL